MSESKFILFVIMTSTIAISPLFVNVIVLLPVFAKINHPDISSLAVGILLA